MQQHGAGPRVAVVVPAYRVSDRILDVIAGIGPEVEAIYVVDDACPESSGRVVEEGADDPRVIVIERAENGGVGAAVKTGYAAAFEAGYDIIVKVDGDGQMDPTLIPDFVRPIAEERADYTKGNRFFRPEDVRRMPRLRLLGNLILSFMTKASSGYWHVFDPTDGYTAIGRQALRWIPLEKVADGYFFESDMLFRLGVLRAVVIDVPIESTYGEEASNLRIRSIFVPFMLGHLKAFLKRIAYMYYLRNFSVASLELLLGLPLVLLGVLLAVGFWTSNSAAGEATTSGEVMIAALPIIVGFQLLLAFVQFDVAAIPTEPLSRTSAVRPADSGAGDHAGTGPDGPAPLVDRTDRGERDG